MGEGSDSEKRIETENSRAVCPGITGNTILLFYFMRLSVFRKIFFCKSNRIRDALRAAAEDLACLYTF